MPSLNPEIRRRVHVTNVLINTGATGLGAGAFVFTLERRSGGGVVSSSETVSVQEIGSGDYWVFYTPTQAATLYMLRVAMVSETQDADVPAAGFQDDVAAVAVSNPGPYLTTRDAFKAAWSAAYKGTDRDAKIDALLPQVTDLFETLCNRKFFRATVTEYPQILGNPLRLVVLRRPPIVTPLSLFLSWSWPRVYDATTQLVEGTDYVVDETSGVVEFSRTRWIACSGSPIKAVRADYDGGYDIIPGDLERAAQEVIGVKIAKASGDLYHLTSDAKNDGSISGLRFDDITPNAMAVIESYRLQVFA